MSKYIKISFLMLIGAVALSSPALAKTPDHVFAISDRLKIFSAPSMSSLVVAKVMAGDELKVLGRTGKFYRIKTSRGRKGFVSIADVSVTEPENWEDDLGLDTVMDPRKMAISESESSHSIRGLREAGKSGGKKATKTTAKQSLKTMERGTPNSAQLKNFQKEGGVGRYAP